MALTPAHRPLRFRVTGATGFRVTGATDQPVTVCSCLIDGRLHVVDLEGDVAHTHLVGHGGG